MLLPRRAFEEVGVGVDRLAAGIRVGSGGGGETCILHSILGQREVSLGRTLNWDFLQPVGKSAVLFIPDDQGRVQSVVYLQGLRSFPLSFLHYFPDDSFELVLLFPVGFCGFSAPLYNHIYSLNYTSQSMRPVVLVSVATLLEGCSVFCPDRSSRRLLFFLRKKGKGSLSSDILSSLLTVASFSAT